MTAEEFFDMIMGQMEMPRGLGNLNINAHVPERAVGSQHTPGNQTSVEGLLLSSDSEGPHNGIETSSDDDDSSDDGNVLSDDEYTPVHDDEARSENGEDDLPARTGKATKRKRKRAVAPAVKAQTVAEINAYNAQYDAHLDVPEELLGDDDETRWRPVLLALTILQQEATKDTPVPQLYVNTVRWMFQFYFDAKISRQRRFNKAGSRKGKTKASANPAGPSSEVPPQRTTVSYVEVKAMRVLREKAKSLRKAIDDGLPYEQHLPSAEEMVGARIVHTTGKPPQFITDSLIDAHALVDRLSIAIDNPHARMVRGRAAESARLPDRSVEQLPIVQEKVNQQTHVNKYLKEQGEEAKKTANEVKEQNETLKTEIGDLKTQIGTLETKIDNHEKEIDHLKKDAEEAESRSKEREERMHDKSTKQKRVLKDLLKRIDSLEQLAKRNEEIMRPTPSMTGSRPRGVLFNPSATPTTNLPSLGVAYNDKAADSAGLAQFSAGGSKRNAPDNEAAVLAKRAKLATARDPTDNESPSRSQHGFDAALMGME